MWFLFFEIWVWLLIAFVLGWFSHWFFCCRNKNDEEKTEDVVTNNDLVTEADSQEIAVSDNWKPLGFSTAPDDFDDLKRIKGVGGVIESTLNELGIFKFSQIAEWSDDNVAWVDNFISFPGRIDRENWRDQAQALASGELTEFAARVDKGDVDYES